MGIHFTPVTPIGCSLGERTKCFLYVLSALAVSSSDSCLSFPAVFVFMIVVPCFTASLLFYCPPPRPTTFQEMNCQCCDPSVPRTEVKRNVCDLRSGFQFRCQKA